MALHFIVPSCTQVQVGELIALTGAEAKHASVVRRVRVGEIVTIGDGAGVWLEGTVEDVSAAQVAVRVSARREQQQPESRIVLVQALAKGDRDELAVQAACELGVDEIVPWQAARSISRWEGAKADKGRERWATIVREAAKQAHRAWVPEVSSVQSTAQLAARAADHEIAFALEVAGELRARADERRTAGNPIGKAAARRIGHWTLRCAVGSGRWIIPCVRAVVRCAPG